LLFEEKQKRGERGGGGEMVERRREGRGAFGKTSSSEDSRLRT